MRRVKRFVVAAIRPPACWASLYLAAIPLFAVAFWQLPPRSLYDTNAALEPATGNDATKVIDAMSPEIRRRVSHTKWRSGPEQFSLDPASLEVAVLRHPQEGHVLIAVTGTAVTTGSKGLIGVDHFYVWLEAMLVVPFVEQASNREPTASYPVTLVDPDTGSAIAAAPGSSPPVSLIMPPPSGALPSASATSGILTLSVRTATELQRFMRAAEGDPYAASERYLRFLYLSATTITTLGLGDITPLTDAARLWIWVEAVSGILLIGLFLNALARGVRSSEPSA
jgi:hypothetical protein